MTTHKCPKWDMGNSYLESFELERGSQNHHQNHHLILERHYYWRFQHHLKRKIYPWDLILLVSRNFWREDTIYCPKTIQGKRRKLNQSLAQQELQLLRGAETLFILSNIFFYITLLLPLKFWFPKGLPPPSTSSSTSCPKSQHNKGQFGKSFDIFHCCCFCRSDVKCKWCKHSCVNKTFNDSSNSHDPRGPPPTPLTLLNVIPSTLQK